MTLVFVAGFFAQALNLGGTFLLALIQVHEVEVIAATFVVATARYAEVSVSVSRSYCDV